jgi:hypothetical protein
VLLDRDLFETAQRASQAFAKSDLVPPHFKGNVANCLIAMSLAHRMNEDPMMVMQNMFIVSGRPGWSAQYMISRANSSGLLKGRIAWDVTGKGDSLSVTARAYLAETGEEIYATADMAMARAENWTKNSKYKTMPELMLRYRSAAMLIRLYMPEVMMGYQTKEEIETMPKAMRDITPEKPRDSLLDSINSTIAGDDAEAATEDAHSPDPEAEGDTLPGSTPSQPDSSAEERAQAYVHSLTQKFQGASDEPALEKLWADNAAKIDRLKQGYTTLHEVVTDAYLDAKAAFGCDFETYNEE